MSDDSWKVLYLRWKDLLDDDMGGEPQQSGHWFSIWRMMIGHSWFQQNLHDSAGYEIIASRLPPDLADDLEQEVILHFAGKLARQPNLGIDLELAKQKFPAFLGTIIRNECRQVARKLRSQFLLSKSLPIPQRIEERSTQRKALVELSLEIDELKDPQRTIILLKLKGMTLREIAQRIPMSYSKVCREYRLACHQLKRRL
jgi:RNA polymerase sigma factor (sigma-70 family)